MSRIQYARMKLQKRVFNFRCRGVFQTPPVTCSDDSNLVILSQLYHPDVTMFMLAAKSFTRFVSPHRFVIVDDGLTEADRSVLSRHLAKVSYVSTDELRTRGYSVPDGGCWERLMGIAEINESNYVIQLDADTLTIRPPIEVIAAIEQERSFTLGTPSGAEITPAEHIAEKAATFKSQHVQARAEAVMNKTTVIPQPRYVRGCAGFAGFRPGSLSPSMIQTFSKEMATLLGEAKWSEWGSEQVTSNFFVANTPESLVLPVDVYPFWSPDRSATSEELKLIHFFGSFRFHGGAYAQLGKQVIKELS